MKKTTKTDRIAIVNEIMKEISLHDRRFFYSSNGDLTAFLSLDEKTGKLWYHSEYAQEYPFNDKKICLSIPKYRTPRDWPHGGTLLGLVRDFSHYIKTGEYSNHLNGYGGLYCPHWGYEKESMVKIQQKAVELGYLVEDEKENKI